MPCGRRLLPSAAIFLVCLVGTSASVAQHGSSGTVPVSGHMTSQAPAALQAAPGTEQLASALVRGGSITISDRDVLIDSRERIPPETRDQVLSRSANVSQIAGNLYARRAMAAEAEAAGLANTPEMQAALRIARDRILSDAWLARIDAQHQITDAAAEKLARNVYRAEPNRFMNKEQVRVRHILFAGTTPESRAQAEKLLDELKAGADFAKLAEASSADKSSAARGGDLGFFQTGRMVPAFEQAAFALEKPGQLSGVVETQFGYHVMKLEERKPAGVRPFEEVREDLIKEIRANVTQQARAEEAQRLQQGMQIDKEAINAFSAGFKPTDVPIKP